ncbi:MAG: type II toxin-antitoxin system PemK/MazF family toxin [Acetobacteraceae bacterium]|nr:type II toxin-antitoxin system PemK/MazF family toxin [Acetobacteraceae bacterium]
MEGVKRGDLVVVALRGESRKPRPALIVQSDAFASLAFVMVIPLTSVVDPEQGLRVVISPSLTNGLRMASHVMVDRTVLALRTHVGDVIGQLDTVTMRSVDQALARFLGLAD